jgi:hypothetical protein
MIHHQILAGNWTDPLTAIGTLAAVFAAIFFFFYERIKNYLNRPILKLGINFYPPECHKTTGSFNNKFANAFWFRLYVTNKGKSNAQNLEVLIEKVDKKTGDIWITNSAFLPSNLKWTHIDVPLLMNLQPGTTKNVDFGYIYDPIVSVSNATNNNLPSENNKIEIVFNVTISVIPFTNYHVLQPGEYLFYLIVGASNCKARREIFRVRFSKEWQENETKMLTETIRIDKYK